MATLNKYMPDVGAELVAYVSYPFVFPLGLAYQRHFFLQLEDEFRYLQKKKNVVKELSEQRQKVCCNRSFLFEHLLTDSLLF